MENACPSETEKVLIHDAARVLVDNATILRCLYELDNAKAVSTVVPVKDTVVETKANKIVNIPDRKSMFFEQTPQGFQGQYPGPQISRQRTDSEKVSFRGKCVSRWFRDLWL